VKAFIRNITFIICFLLWCAWIICAQNPSATYPLPKIFLIIFVGLLWSFGVVGLISDLFEKIIRKSQLKGLKEQEPRPPTSTDFLIQIAEQYHADRREHEWPPNPGILINYLNPPSNLDGWNNDLNFRFDFRTIEHMAYQVLNELRIKKQKGEL
jgi:hypothetical protein